MISLFPYFYPARKPRGSAVNAPDKSFNIRGGALKNTLLHDRRFSCLCFLEKKMPELRYEMRGLLLFFFEHHWIRSLGALCTSVEDNKKER